MSCCLLWIIKDLCNQFIHEFQTSSTTTTTPSKHPRGSLAARETLESSNYSAPADQLNLVDCRPASSSCRFVGIQEVRLASLFCIYLHLSIRYLQNGGQRETDVVPCGYSVGLAGSCTARPSGRAEPHKSSSGWFRIHRSGRCLPQPVR